MDLQKVVAGGGEIWWMNARGGIQADVRDDHSMGDLAGDINSDFDELNEELDEYFHGLASLYADSRG